jgi:uncharacterized protein YbaP (TraB family)
MAVIGFLMAPAMAAPVANIPEPAVYPAEPALQTILVHGSQPGPGLWRVSKGDHTLWILGTLGPLPAGMSWRSGEVEATIAASQEVLGVAFPKADIGVGDKLKMASLMPAALRTQYNPGKATLESVLGSPLHARWTIAKQRYAMPAKEFEKLRPMFASQELYWKAVQAAGLTRDSSVPGVVSAAAEHAGVPIVDTGFSYPLHLDRKELKQRIEAVNASSGADIACFGKTLDVLESDLSMMKLRANAWAVGDVRALRELSTGDIEPPCREVADATFAFVGAGELKQKLLASWLKAARDGLAKNHSTFATLPIADLLDENGALKELQRLGYLVVAPDDEPDEEADE